MDDRPPLSTLLSQVLVAFTIEFDNEFEHRVPHRTTNYGSTGGSSSAPWLVSMAMWLHLMQFVPEEHRKDGVPCRQIPLDEKGETVASLYHWATQDEIEAHVRKWLEKNIHKLEAELEVAETESVQAKNPMDPRPWRDDAPE